MFELATFVAATRPGYDLSKLEQTDRLSVLTVPALANGLDSYFQLYNYHRPHQSLAYRTPAEVHFAQ